MSDSPISQRRHSLETREESLTRQFYEWERRGRGWQVFDYPVEIEPPFRPFYLFDTAGSGAVDDGRRPTFFSRLLDDLKGGSAGKVTLETNQLAEYQAFVAEADEPSLCDYCDEEFVELQMILPKDLRITKAISEQLLLSLSYSSHPLSFEVVGTEKETVVQFASARKDFHQLKQQIKAHLPRAGLREVENSFLIDAWQKNDGDSLIVDFGLSREFMLPLESISNLEIDPLVAITGALSGLETGETGVFQAIFRRARFDWAEEIINSVRCFDGTPFFANAPEMIPLAKEKTSRPLFAVCLRVAAKSYSEERAWRIARNLGAGLAQLSNPTGNELIPLSNDGYNPVYHELSLLNRMSHRCGMILNSEELVSLVHPPSEAVQSEKLVRESERTKDAPTTSLNRSLVLGENEHHGTIRQVTLSNDQRTRHVHLIGSSGSGKSTLLLNLIKQDLEAGQGLCVIDPHGDLIDEVLKNVPENRIKDVVLFDPSDSEYPIGFNILQAKSELEKTLLSSDLVATFRRMSTSWGDVMDSVLANAILAFLESTRGGTLFDLKRFLVEKDFRSEFLNTVEDEAVRYFWTNEFPLITGKPQSSILIRLDTFLRQKLIRNIVCQRDSRINFREIMDNRKVLLVRLAQGAIGEENSYLLGTFVMSKLYQTALSRQDTQSRPFFSCYLDEFHHFITPSMESVLSGVRKYNLGLVLAHQEFRQLQSRSLEVATSVLSNCYTRICFRLGDADAERFASGFSFFDTNDLQNLSVGEAVGRIERAEYDFNLKINSVSKVERETAGKRKAEIIRCSRESFGTVKNEVEANLFALTVQPADFVETTEPVVPETKKKKPERTINHQPAEISGEDNQHRYLQSIVKRIGENNGFIATLEREVFGGIGKIDVALESDTQKIACEIAVTNTTEYEVQNVQKCLASGFDEVAVISSDEKHLNNIRKKTEAALAAEQLTKVHFLKPEQFHSFLENLVSEQPSNKISAKEKVKGYQINTGFKEPPEKEAAERKQTVFEIVSGAIKRRGRK